MSARPPRPMSATPARRPMSAKPVSSCLTSSLSQRFDDDIHSDLDGDEDDIIQDDEDEDVDGMEFGEALERADRQTTQKQKIPIPISVLGNSRGKAFRPTSAPVSRTKPTAQLGLSNKHIQHTKHNDRSVISITYLKEAAEKKKQRDRDFARELLREENEYKKKMTQKIEQANKMSSAFGSKRTFALAPDRDGLHMIRVTDPESTDRVISVENFLKEFERLASVQIGQAPLKASTPSKKPGTTTNDGEKTTSMKKSKHRIHGIRTSRLSSTVDIHTGGNGGSDRPFMSNTKRLITKATDRSLVQEELKSVLASTIELTKVLQDQLHELKLKGWNFSSRTGQTTTATS